MPLLVLLLRLQGVLVLQPQLPILHLYLRHLQRQRLILRQRVLVLRPQSALASARASLHQALQVPHIVLHLVLQSLHLRVRLVLPQVVTRLVLVLPYLQVPVRVLARLALSHRVPVPVILLLLVRLKVRVNPLHLVPVLQPLAQRQLL